MSRPIIQPRGTVDNSSKEVRPFVQHGNRKKCENLDLTGARPHHNLRQTFSLYHWRQSLRQTLMQQSTPIVAALHRWSRFSTKALWGMLTWQIFISFSRLARSSEPQGRFQ